MSRGFGIAGLVVGDVPFIFAILYLGVGLVVISGAAYLATKALDVRFHAHKLVAIRRWLGLALSRRELTPARIAYLELSSRSENSYRIRARLPNGVSVTLAEGLRGHQAATALRDLIAKTLGVPARAARVAASSDIGRGPRR